MKLTIVLSVCLALFAPAAMALAGQLQPTQPVPVNLYSGRWYEIARTPNHMEGDGQAATTDFSGWAAGAFQAVWTWHRGAPDGPATKIVVSGRVLPATQNAKMQLAMLGGLMTQQYWILDHAADDGWLIMAIPNDRYVWLFSRQPALTAAARAAAMARLQQLGFDLSHLAFPQQLGR